MKRIHDAQTWKLLFSAMKLGSLSKAAFAENMDLADASRTIANLEKEIGFPLFDRKKRPAVLTVQAQKLTPFVQKFIRSERNLEAELAQIHNEYEARSEQRIINVSLPVNMDRSGIYTSLERCAAHFANLKIEISADSGIPALLSGKTDISLGSYRIEDDGLFCLPAAKGYTFLMASEKYKRRYGLPNSIEDLKNHHILNRFRTNLSYSDRLENGEETFFLDSCRHVLYGDALACRDMLLFGQGIAIDINVGFVARELSSGAVFPVLKGWHRPAWEYSVYCRASDADDPVIRELMGTIRKNLFPSFADRWEFWYEKFGIPMP